MEEDWEIQQFMKKGEGSNIVGILWNHRSDGIREYTFKFSRVPSWSVLEELRISESIQKNLPDHPQFSKVIGTTHFEVSLNRDGEIDEVMFANLEGSSSKGVYRLAGLQVPVTGITFANHISTGCDESFFLNNLRHILFATWTAWNRIGWTHSDYHTNNAIVQDCSFDYILYEDGELSDLVPTQRQIPVIIDYEYSYVNPELEQPSSVCTDMKDALTKLGFTRCNKKFDLNKSGYFPNISFHGSDNFRLMCSAMSYFQSNNSYTKTDKRFIQFQKFLKDKMNEVFQNQDPNDLRGWDLSNGIMERRDDPLFNLIRQTVYQPMNNHDFVFKITDVKNFYSLIHLLCFMSSSSDPTTMTQYDDETMVKTLMDFLKSVSILVENRWSRMFYILWFLPLYQVLGIRVKEFLDLEEQFIALFEQVIQEYGKLLETLGTWFKSKYWNLATTVRNYCNPHLSSKDVLMVLDNLFPVQLSLKKDQIVYVLPSQPAYDPNRKARTFKITEKLLSQIASRDSKLVAQTLLHMDEQNF